MSKEYATLSATYIIEDINLLKKRHKDSQFGDQYLKEIADGEYEFMASQAILDLLNEGVRPEDMGVEFFSSACEPNSEDDTYTAVDRVLV